MHTTQNPAIACRHAADINVRYSLGTNPQACADLVATWTDLDWRNHLNKVNAANQSHGLPLDRMPTDEIRTRVIGLLRTDLPAKLLAVARGLIAVADWCADHPTVLVTQEGATTFTAHGDHAHHDLVAGCGPDDCHEQRHTGALETVRSFGGGVTVHCWTRSMAVVA